MTSLFRAAFKLNAADRCQRCGGVQVVDTDEYGPYIICLTCSRVKYPDVRSESETATLTEYKRLKAENPDYADVLETPGGLDRKPPIAAADILPETMQEALSLFRLGGSWAQIRDATGVSEWHVRQAVEPADMAEREAAKQRAKDKRTAEYVALARIIEQGRTRQELAAYTGLPISTLDGRIARGKKEAGPEQDRKKSAGPHVGLS